MDSLIFAYYNAIISVAVFVFFIYGEIIINKIATKNYDKIFDFALGIFLISAGTAANRLFFSSKRVLDSEGVDVDWLQNHPILFIVWLPLFLGYLWHIRTMTKDKYNWNVLLFACVSAIITFVLSWFFFVGL